MTSNPGQRSEPRVWCGWCKYYVIKSAYEKFHVPRHEAAILRAAQGPDGPENGGE